MENKLLKMVNISKYLSTINITAKNQVAPFFNTKTILKSQIV